MMTGQETRRGWLQFSLKSIFVLILVVAAFFGGMAVQRREMERALRQAQEEREVSERQAMDAMLAERATRTMAEAERARAEVEVERARARTDDGSQ
jgi:hypothetical protein